MRGTWLVALVCATVALTSCTDRGAPGQPSSPGATAQPASGAGPGAGGAPAGQAAALVSRLSAEELIGQVLMPYAYGNSATAVSGGSAAANRAYSGVSTPADMIAKYRLGGVILMGWSADDPTAGTNPSSNVEDPAQIRRLTDGLQVAAAALPARVPLLIGTDQEYGQVTRIRDGMVQLPAALAFGAADDPALTERAWRGAGAELAALGINVDFAPDADVLGDQPGGVIGSRSFGSDPAKVAAQVAAAVRGLQAAGVSASIKHFPGHGHTTVDSHTSLPALTQSRAALDSDDLPPFAAGIEAGAGLVMVGHLDVRSVDPGVAASFSPKVLVDLLRGKLGFTGVVVSDALNMDPAKRWAPGETEVRALLAGNDLLLMPRDLAAAQRALLAALSSGRLPRARLIEAVTRVLTLKFRLSAQPRPEMSVVNSAPNRDAALAVAAAAVTVLRGACGSALISGPVRVTATSGSERARDWLSAALVAQGMTMSPTGRQIHLMGYGKSAANAVPVAAAAITVALDTPYVLRYAGSATLVATYSSAQVSMEALAAVIAGKARAAGHAPVPVAGLPRSACG